MNDEYFGYLFSPKTLARITDPQTSKRAAEHAPEFMSKHHRRIYNTLKDIGEGTTYEISNNCNLDHQAITRRMNELEKLGRVYTAGERPGPSGRLCRIWRIT